MIVCVYVLGLIIMPTYIGTVLTWYKVSAYFQSKTLYFNQDKTDEIISN